MEEKGVGADKIDIPDITRNLVIDYLKWLQDRRGNSIATRNQRQAAVNSFINYLVYEFPEYMSEYQRILNIPIKKAPQKDITYLKTDEVKILINQVDVDNKNGLRDYVILY